MSQPNIGPLCHLCKHIRRDYRCRVFPKGIPEIVLYGHNHTTPVPGDGGVIFEARGPGDPEPNFVDLMLKEIGPPAGNRGAGK